MSRFRKGDRVYVVRQQYRGRGLQEEGEYCDVDRVGRKLGYVFREGHQQPFLLETGKSHHTGPHAGNARANGFGFDVFESESAFRESREALDEFKRLGARLSRDGKSHWIKKLPSDVVRELHRVLDEAQEGEG